MILSAQERMCDVCRLLDFDTEKKLCTYCGLCDAWICASDSDKWTRRIQAAIKRQLEPGYQGRPDYVTVAQSELEGKQ